MSKITFPRNINPRNLGILIGLLLAAVLIHNARAIVSYAPSAALGVGSVQSKHILDGTLQGRDINQSTWATTTRLTADIITATTSLTAASSTIGTLNVGAVRATTTSYFIGAVTTGTSTIYNATIGSLGATSSISVATLNVSGSCTGCASPTLTRNMTATSTMGFPWAVYASSTIASSTGEAAPQKGDGLGIQNTGASDTRMGVGASTTPGRVTISGVTFLTQKNLSPNDLDFFLKEMNGNTPGRTLASSTITAANIPSALATTTAYWTPYTTAEGQSYLVGMRVIGTAGAGNSYITQGQCQNSAQLDTNHTSFTVSQAGVWSTGMVDCANTFEEILNWSLIVASTSQNYVGPVTNDDPATVRQFIGFTTASTTIDNVTSITINGVVEGFTNLMTGYEYSTASSSGRIAQATSTTSRIIGKAISGTALLIQSKPAP